MLWGKTNRDNMHFDDTYYTPDDKRQLELMRETEDRQAQERKHTCFCGIKKQKRRVKFMLTEELLYEAVGLWKSPQALTTHEGHGSKSLLHENLGNWRQVMMSVMRHDNSREQYGHDPYKQKDNSDLFWYWNHNTFGMFKLVRICF